MAADHSVYNRGVSAALGLLRLQQVDSRIDRQQSRLQNIQEALANNTELAAVHERLSAAKADRHTAESERRLAEAEAQIQQDKIRQAESRLYGGTVRNPKELQDLQADVASLKKHLEALEERQLQAMLRVDSSQVDLDTAEKHANEVQTRFGDEYGKLMEERNLLSRDQEQLLAERNAAVGAISAGILGKYEALRQRHGGLAVAEVSDDACAACGTALTAALQQSARHAAELVYCPSCGRVLYAG